MRYEGPVYRPLSEADSLLIQANVGCPHSKGSFLWQGDFLKTKRGYWRKLIKTFKDLGVNFDPSL
jgi:hypothetical protein